MFIFQEETIKYDQEMQLSQTNPRHSEEVTQNTENSENTVSVKQRALSYSVVQGGQTVKRTRVVFVFGSYGTDVIITSDFLENSYPEIVYLVSYLET